jgi:hypothetical protein
VGDVDAIIVFDCAKLERKSENEYWFKQTPKGSALLIYTVSAQEDEVDEPGGTADD